jgi:DNA-binding response OmpR family regulator
VRTVLIVDENEVIRGLVQTIVESAGHQAVQAGTCEAGYRLARRGTGDAIVLDCMQNNGDGIALLKRLRAEVATAATPIVAMCGMSQSETDLAQWADAVVTKPFRPGQLILKLGSVFRQRLHVTPNEETANARCAP